MARHCHWWLGRGPIVVIGCGPLSSLAACCCQRHVGESSVLATCRRWRQLVVVSGGGPLSQVAARLWPPFGWLGIVTPRPCHWRPVVIGNPIVVVGIDSSSSLSACRCQRLVGEYSSLAACRHWCQLVVTSGDGLLSLVTGLVIGCPLASCEL